MTSFYLVLSQNFLDSTFLRQIREIGFLAQFESLLSSMGESRTCTHRHERSLSWAASASAGDESGMLEDMCVAVAELSTVTFQVCAHFYLHVQNLFSLSNVTSGQK